MTADPHHGCRRPPPGVGTTSSCPSAAAAAPAAARPSVRRMSAPPYGCHRAVTGCTVIPHSSPHRHNTADLVICNSPSFVSARPQLLRLLPRSRLHFSRHPVFVSLSASSSHRPPARSPARPPARCLPCFPSWARPHGVQLRAAPPVRPMSHSGAGRGQPIAPPRYVSHVVGDSSGGGWRRGEGVRAAEDWPHRWARSTGFWCYCFYSIQKCTGRAVICASCGSGGSSSHGVCPSAPAACGWFRCRGSRCGRRPCRRSRGP